VEEPLRFALLGLGAGAVYTLAAQGIVLVYRGSGILNFAQGAIGMVGAFLFFELRDERGWEWKLAFLVSVLACAAIGAAIQFLVMHNLRRASAISRLIATLGLLVLLQAFVVRYFGAENRLVSGILPTDTVEIFGTTISRDRLILATVAIVVSIALFLIYRYTRFGLATSAVAENQVATAALGRSPNLIAAVNWTAAGVLAGVAAILFAPLIGLNPGLFTLLVIPALAAALVGGFTSFSLTAVAGFAIGIAESEMARYIDTPGWSKSVPFLVIIAVLVIRGRGLPLRSERAEKPPLLGDGRVNPWFVSGAVVVGLALVMFVFDDDWISAFTTSGIFAIVALSLVVVTGYAGQLSLAQMALAGMGAWFSGRLIDNYGISFELAILAGIALCVPVGLAVALPALRTRGVNLAVATLGLALVIERLILLNPELTGKFEGTQIGDVTLLGIDVSSVRHPERYAVVVMLFFLVAALLVANLRRGRAGRRLIAVRTNERAAAALGISVFGAKLVAFAIAAAIAAVGGILIAFRNPTVVFTPFTVFASIDAVVFTVIGGIGFILGPLLGSTLSPGGIGEQVFAFLGEDVETIFQLFAGALLISILLQEPNGLVPLNKRQMGSLLRRLRIIGPPRVPDARPLPTTGRDPVTPRTLEVRDLTVRFGGVVALDAVSLAVRPGEVVGLIGPNGAGKTTLVDAATGFVKPADGRVTLDGESIARWTARKRSRAGIGRSFQSLELFEDMTVRDNLRTGSDRKDPWAYLTDLVWPGDPALSPTAVAAVREFGLEDDLERKPGELPYGRRRLVGIARTVATAPSVLLLDEPAAGLDENETDELSDLIRRLADDWGLAVLLIEHDVGMVMRTCDRVVALDFGEKIAEGTPDEIRSDDAVVIAYLGDFDTDTANAP